ncbi:MAG: HAMP domain-containing histidine kinase [Ruminococcaceae bacterium]|nr:HAMP domain-containing histidine kinase [Oscillospiraceae bacterium]
MKSKLFNKFFFTISAIIIVSLTVVLAVISFVISNYFSKEKYTLLNENCTSVSRMVVSEINSSNFRRNIYNIIRVQNDVSDADIFICDTNGKIIVCGCDEYLMGDKCIHMAFDIPKDILKNAKNNEFAEIGTLGGLYGENHYLVGNAIIGADKSIYGYAFAATSAQTLKELLYTLRRMSLFYCIFPIIITFFVLYSLTYKFSKPLKSMSEAAKRMSRGDFSRRIPVISDDEIGQLSISFNNMTDSLARLEKMRRNFIGNVSHELRTPMTTIAGFIDGIIDGTIEDDKRDYYLKIVSVEVKRLSRVVESMLNLAELESGHKKINPSKFNISECIVNIILGREQTINGKDINVLGLDTLEAAEIRADYDLIYQVIYNLIDNAVKFTNQGGTISFKLLKTKSNVQFSIRNTGDGISKDGIEHIFERFYKGDKARSKDANSTGIGLFIVKKIIEIHGGKIVADSVENEYTVFKVMLPLDCLATEEKVNGRKQIRNR